VPANLFMHYAFDAWMAREFPGCPFVRYADDAVVHGESEDRARQVLAALHERMGQVGLRLHPDKTKIVYCRGMTTGKARMTGWTRSTSWKFTFRARSMSGKRGRFNRFGPAASGRVLARMSETVRSWRLHRHVGRPKGLSGGRPPEPSSVPLGRGGGFTSTRTLWSGRTTLQLHSASTYRGRPWQCACSSTSEPLRSSASSPPAQAPARGVTGPPLPSCGPAVRRPSPASRAATMACARSAT
jgi:Reverse transcriptase (RNA-dependent DNA polymerase)